MKKLIFSLIVAVSLLSVSFSFAGNFDTYYDQDGNYSVNPGGSVDNYDQDGNYSYGQGSVDNYDQDGNYSYGQVNPGGSVDNSDQDGNYSQGTIK
jgi:hypothetical protein